MRRENGEWKILGYINNVPRTFLLYDHTSVRPSLCLFLVPAIKELEHNRNDKMHVAVNHISHYFSAYRAIRNNKLWMGIGNRRLSLAGIGGAVIPKCRCFLLCVCVCVCVCVCEFIYIYIYIYIYIFILQAIRARLVQLQRV